MPIKCYVKPNRTKPRLFSIPDAARIYCEARQNSGLGQDAARELFIFEVNQRCGWGFDETSREAERKALEALADVLEEIAKALPWAKVLKRVGDILSKLPAPIRDRITAAVGRLLERLKSGAQKAIDRGREILKSLPPPP